MPMLAGHKCRAEMASDLMRDGMSLELSEPDGALVAEVFYSDVTNTMTFTTYLPDLPPEAAEWLIREARVRLPPVARRADL